MNLEQMLIKYHTIPQEILRLNQDLKTAIEAATNNDGCIRAATVSDMPKTHSNGEPTYEHVADLIEQLELIGIELANMAWKTKDSIKQLRDIKCQVDTAYFLLEPEEQKIIRLRYFEMPEATWEKVADEAHYCKSQAILIHNQAVKKMKNII